MTQREKKTKDFAKRLLSLCVVDGEFSEPRLTAVLETLERHPPRHYLATLKELLRFARREIARRTAIVERAGELDEDALGRIQNAMTSAYGHPIAVVARENRELLAGLRVTVDCDVYENSIASALRSLESSLSV